MSDVLVKGMNMPTACRSGKCDFACSAAYQTGLICVVRKQYVVPGDVPTDCPCSLVLPHGDLIERSAASLSDFEIAMCGGNYKEGMKMLLEKIEAAPTIIPAEEG